jgi:hypothetical protein
MGASWARGRTKQDLLANIEDAKHQTETLIGDLQTLPHAVAVYVAQANGAEHPLHEKPLELDDDQLDDDGDEIDTGPVGVADRCSPPGWVCTAPGHRQAEPVARGKRIIGLAT